tara:strand:- start:1834 stop:2151 length:318 start_codon:yes stop_codon:yes gene_type:complete
MEILHTHRKHTREKGEEVMLFEDILALLRSGERVYRAAWKNGDFIFMIPGLDNVRLPCDGPQAASLGVLNVTTRTRIDYKHDGGDLIIGWTPNVYDIFAEDWEVK